MVYLGERKKVNVSHKLLFIGFFRSLAMLGDLLSTASTFILLQICSICIFFALSISNQETGKDVRLEEGINKTAVG